jgi:hypothetical protein
VIRETWHSTSLVFEFMARWACAAAFLLLAIQSADAVDRTKYRRCDQSGFCTRLRAQATAPSPQRQQACSPSLKPRSATLAGSLVSPSGADVALSIAPTHTPGVLRLRARERNVNRYAGPTDVVLPGGPDGLGSVVAVGNGTASLEFDAPGGRRATARVNLCPFSIGPLLHPVLYLSALCPRLTAPVAAQSCRFLATRGSR